MKKHNLKPRQNNFLCTCLSLKLAVSTGLSTAYKVMFSDKARKIFFFFFFEGGI